ncbi:Tex family protein [Thalassoroseus pseudoceratinae]|uniref:Tex family protein n=1 Tax=Thalassoroseus pseudoceratinae TaxID=2713176 RepID=UPI001424A424|nr:Tex family protein [Thalassoroseus pseudoceratinae]
MDAAAPVDFSQIATELNIREPQVRQVVALLDDGNTVPFITRYRKEQTGNLDEEAIRQIQEQVDTLRQIAERRQAILRLIESQGKLTPELRTDIESADSLKRLEDLYLPYRPKRQSRATKAKERGLEPLADAIWNQTITDLSQAAAEYVDSEKEVGSAEDALNGASDILAERISETAAIRDACRKLANDTGKLEIQATKAGKENGSDFRDYFDYSEQVSKIPPHRVLAINRGENTGMLRVRFTWNDARAEVTVSFHYRFPDHRFSQFLTNCASDALSRLIKPSLDREIRRELTEAAERHAVEVFAQNLRSLLLGAPLPNTRVVAIDPGFRTGCKIAALDESGNLIAHDVISILGKDEQKAEARQKLHDFLAEHNAKLIAIGNGTACRETEELVSELIEQSMPDVRYVVVNEAGASVYSASSVARDEFPNLDATVRGTVSIGRRLQDPLSELVKIEPQHIGVGMYQHDVSEKRLQESLSHVVESCVNFVGVDLNTASASLLKHVSGFNQLVARRVVEWREKNGRFENRRQLLDVSGIGEATFTQAAGFLKVPGGPEPLDATWIHPESYGASRKILERLELSPQEILKGDETIRSRFRELDAKSLSSDINIGLPTCRDILEALARPGRDPRAELPGVLFKKGVLKLEDLANGMKLQGTVLNVVDFGAFVDIGLKDSGLVHISKMANRFVSNPHEIVAVGDVVTVWVLNVDLERRRVSLTMLPPEST